MKRCKQLSTNKRRNKGRYIYGLLGIYYAPSTYRSFKIAWQRDKRIMQQTVIVEGD